MHAASIAVTLKNADQVKSKVNAAMRWNLRMAAPKMYPAGIAIRATPPY
jgi:hypothetical protein